MCHAERSWVCQFMAGSPSVKSLYQNTPKKSPLATPNGSPPLPRQTEFWCTNVGRSGLKVDHSSSVVWRLSDVRSTSLRFHSRQQSTIEPCSWIACHKMCSL